MADINTLLGYNPQSFERETNPFYIGASDADIEAMLSELGLNSLEDLYAHVPEKILMTSAPAIEPALDYELLARHLIELSQKNQNLVNFAGDGLQAFAVSPIVPYVASLRELTTAYTPYQPERSQGTLMTLWLYQSCLSALTGFEAINASMYDRSSAAFEAMNCALRLVRDSDTILVAASIYPGDWEVLKTHADYTRMNLVQIPLNPSTGLMDLDLLQAKLSDLQGKVAAVLFPQTSHFGGLENVDRITDLIHEHKALAIAVVDPMLLAEGGLKPPTLFGQKGADMLVGEGQHLAIGPNFGGPGLGIFGIRFNKENRNAIRSSAGRYVGHARDLGGIPCKVMVLSTREQHIRKDKATSNICSNQSFVATLAGAAILARGAKGMQLSCTKARKMAHQLAQSLSSLSGVSLAFSAPFYNEFTLELNSAIQPMIQAGLKEGLLIGCDVSDRFSGRNLLLISLSDVQTDADLQRFTKFFEARFQSDKQSSIAEIPAQFLRQGEIVLPKTDLEGLKLYYRNLANQNISPDQGPYPLGSCTMKYNPRINDFAASLEGFTNTHPEAPEEAVQGNLAILYSIQEMFKGITGLPAVTTQPVAGAQGELVGIKMIQAYHKDHSAHKRDVLLLPRSAHGTNFATATMAGFETKGEGATASGIQLIEADATGQICMDQLKSQIECFNQRIAGIMITNPNTCGITETRFAEIARMVHSVGGLVYMDGANMNAIAGWLDLGKMGVDAVHQNLHKTWSIPHGGGGPGDGVVAVSEKLAPYLPGIVVVKEGLHFRIRKAEKSVGSFHRHFGNFAHKIRCYTYIRALGPEGVRKMSATAVLSSAYLYKKLSQIWPSLPSNCKEPRMHEFILTLPESVFQRIESAGISHALAISRIGKLFLDFGMHAPTVAWPETYGLMIEPTESFSKAELDRFAEVVTEIYRLIQAHPEVLLTAPHFTPVQRIDDVEANKNLVLSQTLNELPPVEPNRLNPAEILNLRVSEISKRILEAHHSREKSIHA